MQKLASTHISALETVLSRVTNEADGITVTYFHGFITCIALSVEPIPSSHWLPIILKDGKNNSQLSPTEMNFAIKTFMDYYHLVTDALANNIRYDPFPGQLRYKQTTASWCSWVLGFSKGLTVTNNPSVNGKCTDNQNVSGPLAVVELLARVVTDPTCFPDDVIASISKNAEGYIVDIVRELRKLNQEQNCELVDVDAVEPHKQVSNVIRLWGNHDHPYGYCLCGSRQKFANCCGTTQ